MSSPRNTARHSHLYGDTLCHKLYNAVVDTVLVYGLDETCRALDIDGDGTIQDDYEKLLVRDIKLQFLQVLGPGIVHPRRTSHKSSPTVPVSSHAQTPTGDRTASLGEGAAKKFRMEDLGFTVETIESLQYFIYPEGCQLSPNEKVPACVPLLLTDVLGERYFAMAIKFTRPFFIQKPSDGGCGHYNLIPSTVTDCPANCKLIFLPTCIVLVSKRPYFKFLKEALSGIYRMISDEDNVDSFWDIIHDIAEKLFLLPCLPEGMLSLEVTLPGFSSPTLIMPPRGDLHLDIHLNYPFLCLSVDNILTVIAALLCEQTIIFTSSNYSMPAYVIQCFLSYIAPFEWRHSIVPIVPDELIDMLGAPSINLIGCHANQQDSPEFGYVDEAVIVKLDEDIVEPRLSAYSLPELPEVDRNRFKTQYQEILEGDFEIDSLERLILPSAIERERRKSNFEHYKDTTLSALFLELMVRVFDFVAQDLKKSRAVFEEHLKALPEKDQTFYKHATQTDMFSLFMTSRKLGKRDNFSVLADQIKKYLRPMKGAEGFDTSVSLPFTSLPINPLTRRSRCSIVNTMLSGQSVMKQSISGSMIAKQFSAPEHRGTAAGPEERNTPFISWSYSKTTYFKELQCLEFPSFEAKLEDRGKFIDQILATLKDLMNDKTIQPSCCYLYGYYKIARGNVLEGLELLCDNLKILNPNVVPNLQQRLELVSLLSNDEREALQKKTFYKDLIPRQGLPIPGHHRDTGVGLFRPFGRQRVYVHSDFSKEVTQVGITKDPESASNLFSILQSVGRSASVCAEVVQAFVESWKQVIQELEQQVSSYRPTDPQHGVQERLLAFNSNLRSNAGAHCQVLLTTHRIIVLSNAGMKERVFAVLSDMTLDMFCKCELALALIGQKIPVIKLEPTATGTRNRITGVRGKTSDPYIGFPSSELRDLWYRMMKEVVCGWHMVVARKDPTIMDQVESHIKLILALHRTGWLNEIETNVKNKWEQKILSIQSKPVQLDNNATEALQYRINPNTYNIEKATIESTLFVPSNVAGGDGKLWLGLGNGCLRVYDMEARCFDSDLKIMDARRGKTVRVSCLLLVDYHVWVGSLNKTIHILDVETLCHVSQLSYLEDEPRDLVLSKTEPVIVWSLLLNGVILGFDPETREKVAKIIVPNMTQHSFCTCFTIWREFLWVGTNKGTIAVMNSTNGTFVTEIVFPGNHRTVDIKYLALSNKDEIWCSVHSFPRSKESTFIAAYSPHNYMRLYTYCDLDSNHRVSFILPVKNTMWCGTKSGKIYVFSSETSRNRDGPKILDAHDDKIRSMTYTDNDLVISGSGSNDGYANVWRLMNWFGD